MARQLTYLWRRALTDGDDAGGVGHCITNNVTADTFNIPSNQAVTDIETNVATLGLTSAATSITETDGVILGASTVSKAL